MRKCCHGAEHCLKQDDSRKKAHHEKKHKKFIFSSIIFDNPFDIWDKLFQDGKFFDHDARHLS
jgi:hypothetical protein